MNYENAATPFICVIDESGQIWETATGRKRQAVGIDLQREQDLLRTIDEMKEVLDGYYNKLVELGAIVPQKTAEQIAAEQLEVAREQMNKQADINQALLEVIAGLKGELLDIKTANKPVPAAKTEPVEEKPLAKAARAKAKEATADD